MMDLRAEFSTIAKTYHPLRISKGHESPNSIHLLGCNLDLILRGEIGGGAEVYSHPVLPDYYFRGGGFQGDIERISGQNPVRSAE